MLIIGVENTKKNIQPEKKNLNHVKIFFVGRVSRQTQRSSKLHE